MSIISGFILPCGKKIYIALRTVVLAIASNTYYLIKYLLFLPKNIKQELIEKPEMEHPIKAFGWAARDSSGILAPFKFSRRATGDHDVQLKILYCGICHSDLHSIKNDGGVSTYPQVPGHEITGIVTEVGSKVKKFKVGDKVGVGCMVGSCRNCDQCVNNLENYCPIKPVFTYNSVDFDGTRTHGGYSNIMVANEHFVIRWPESLPLDTGAPLLCAGTTTYSAMKYYGLDKPGLHVGVVGLGGLGHVAVKFLKAFGAKVTVISTSASKRDDAVKTLGLDGFLVSRNEEEMNAAAATLDGIIDTVSAVHPIGLLVGLLKTHGKMVVLGVPEKLELPVVPIVLKRKMVGGSLIGGLKETQEMIDFAAEHKIVAEVEIIPMDYVNKAMERLAKADVKYRFVIDVGKTVKAE